MSIGGIYLFVAQNNTTAADYRASGIITSKVYDPVISVAIEPGHEIVQHQYRKHFDVVVKDCRWLIRITPLPDDIGGTPVILVEAAFDGTNTYYYSKVDTNRIKQLPGTRFIANGTGTIQTGDVPNPNWDFVTPVWLAYASSCYYKESLPMVKPIWRVDSNQAYDRYFVKAFAEYFQAGSIKRIAYMNSGVIPIVDDVGTLSQVRFDSPYSEGFTNAVFYVEQLTNVEGMISVPSTFRTTLFCPKGSEAKASSELQVVHSYEGKLEFVSSSEQQGVFEPMLAGQNWITDRRILTDHKNKDRSYMTSKWLGTNDPKIVKLLEVERRQTAGLKFGEKRFLAVGLISLISGVFLAKLVKTKNKKNNK